MKRRYRKSISIPAIRKFREAVENGTIGGFLIEAGEETNAGSISVKYRLKYKPYVITLEARRMR